ncbi:hypothetical protein D3C78_1374760 [compost metagenome]
MRSTNSTVIQQLEASGSFGQLVSVLQVHHFLCTNFSNGGQIHQFHRISGRQNTVDVVREDSIVSRDVRDFQLQEVTLFPGHVLSALIPVPIFQQVGLRFGANNLDVLLGAVVLVEDTQRFSNVGDIRNLSQNIGTINSTVQVITVNLKRHI